ncbi:MAG TPA: hypothetical protein VIJ90_03555 [Gemmatimonadaceae bacterium]
MTAVAIAATPVRARTGWVLPALVIVIAVAIARWATVPYVVGVFHDDGIYALLARSIATGQGFHYSHLPGLPAATHYPPLYPLFLAAAWRIAPSFPENVSFLLGLNALLVGVAAFGWWRFATMRLAWKPAYAAAGALAATLALPVLALAGALLSEPLFLALLWPALILSERVADSADRARTLGAGALIGALMLVRTHALALLLALLLVLAVRRRWRDAIALGAAATLVQLPWLLWTHWATPHVSPPLEGAYGSYLGWFAAGVRHGGPSFVLATMRVNGAECWLLLQDRLASGFPVPVHQLTLAIALGAMAVGAWSFARRAPVTIVFLALYLGVVLVFPYTPWRYMWAVWPLIALLVMEGVRASWSLARRWRVAVAIGAALLALAFLRTELHGYAMRAWRVPARQASAQIAPVVAWVRAHTDEHDVVLSEGEQVVALYSGRQAAPPISSTAREYLVQPQPAENAARLAAMLAAVPSRYVILLASPMVQSANALAGRHPGLRPIESLSTGVVYEVVP